MNAGTVTPVSGKNPKTLYEHQIDAMQALDKLNKKDEFRSLLVLPTGGGKTLTAAYWLLKNVIDQGKKILWIAHRHLLLEQAADTFIQNAYTDIMINRTPFNYRIISGIHDKPVHIKKDDTILIAGKDSIIRNLNYLDEWIENEEVYLIIDEAHHAVAKTYKRIINYVFEHAKNAKMLGLTATPFRTSEHEKGALKAIFQDDIVYKTDLDTLIKKEILATPICKEFETDILFGDTLGVKALKSIENLDVIPENIVKEIADNSVRNRLIVETYFKDYQTYGPTIVFALNQNHAIALNALFNEYGKEYGIESDFIISSVRDSFTGVTISNKENEEKIERYKNGKIQVLINVNILTEGTDLPKTHTVFLTRPTVSTVLMTQMVGRALRGLRANGTKEAYIVSFLDDWNNKIAWVNPEMLIDGPVGRNTPENTREYNLRLIAISLLEQLALMADDTVDTSELERIKAINRIPLGMYTFAFTEFDGKDSLERNHQILVYNSTKVAYKKFITDLPVIIEEHNILEETIPEDILEQLLEKCKNEYFDDDMIPAYNPKDIEYLLKFYAQKSMEPLFITLDEVDRKRLDVSTVAEEIRDKDMRISEMDALCDQLWNEEGSIFPIYYSNYYFFRKMIQIELEKGRELSISDKLSKPKSSYESREREKLTLYEIRQHFPEYYQELVDYVTEKSIAEDNNYVCAECGIKTKLWGRMQIDHIKPMAHGGLSVPENLQLLCRPCNLRKRDKLNNEV